jgi:hypothetical protein
MGVLSTIQMYQRFVFGLPPYLRRPQVTIDQAIARIRRGLENRNANFLHIARSAIYDNPRSGYLPLLEMAGCEFGDLEASVADKGLEATLRLLRAEGVYVSFEEYKGRRPMVRGGRTIELDEQAFDNPLTSKAYEGTTGGTTGVGTRVETDLDNIYAQVPHLMLVRHVNGVLGAPMAVYKGEFPDPVGVGVFLRCTAYGAQVQRWFTPVTRDYYSPPLRFRLATAYVVWMSWLCGRPCPRPERLPLDRAIVLARWAAAAVKEHGRAEIVAAASLGVRICLAAAEDGLDLTGTVFIGGGEPYTPAKRVAFDRVGAHFAPIYIGEDTGPIGLPCTNPIEENDQHLLEDNLALIQYPREVLNSGVEVDAFYFSSLAPLASKVLFNMESEDYGIVEERSCGCALEEVGYHRHVRRIRSFGKLTGEGVTLVGSEMIRILEEALPARFGGGPQDFQLLEEDDAQGFTRLALVAHPRLDLPPDAEVIEGLLQEIAQGTDAGGLASSFWQQADTFSVRRQEPIWTARGKFMPIRVAAIHDAPKPAADEVPGS